MQGAWTPVCTFDVASQMHILSNDQEIGWIKRWPNPFTPDVIIVTLDGDKLIPFHWEHRFTGFGDFLTMCHEVFRISVILIGGHLSFYRLDVNCSMFNHYIDSEGCIPGEMHVISLMKEKIKMAQICVGSHKSYQEEECVAAELTQCHDTWSLVCSLTKDQEKSVKWMQHMEACILTKNNKIRYATCVPVGSTGWAYDCTTEVLSRWENTAWLKTRFRGAVLTNPVNTGKTACALYLIRASLDTFKPCTQYDNPAFLTNQKGTLVVVPQNIVGQWACEIAKFLELKNLNVTYLSEAKDLRKVSYLDIQNSDIVITTTNLLKTKAYADLIDNFYRDLFGYDVDRKLHREPNVMQMATRKIRITGSLPKFPFIELMHWHRVIVDEIHEFFTGSSVSRDRQKFLKNLTSDIWWGLTGTPNTRTSESMQSFYFFLAPKLCDDAQEYHHHPCLEAAVKQTLLKSFASSAKDPIHHLHLLTPSAAEVAVLETLCNVPLEQFILNSITVSLHQSFIGQLSEESTRMMLFHSKGHAPQQYRDFLDDQFKALSSDTCTICMDCVCDTVLGCGHVFCRHCLGRIMFGDHQCSRLCPTCRVHIDRYDAVQVTTSDSVPSWGTRLFELSKVVVGLLARGESVVLFVQWKTAEDAVVSVLKSFGIDVLRLSGTVTTRNTVLKKFTEEGSKAIVLSLDQSSSGLHLSAARHAIFVHAIAETKNSDYERQALGRLSRYESEVHVHHLVLKNTREHEIWMAAHTGKIVRV